MLKHQVNGFTKNSLSLKDSVICLLDTVFVKIQNQKRILIIDDEKDSTGLVMHHLALQMQIAGCQILHANVESDTLEVCKKYKPTLIILDLMVPEIEGWRILKRLRDESQTKDISVMIMTECAGTGFDVGADDYMTKPFSPRELVTRVNRFLKKTKVKSRFFESVGRRKPMALLKRRRFALS